MTMTLYVSTIDLEWEPGKRIAQGSLEQYLPQFSKYMAKIMAEEIVKAIDNQRFKSKWAPLKIGYLKYKQRHDLSTKVWEATSVLKDNIKAYRYRDRWVVGIPKSRTYPGTSLRVYQVAQYLEYGTTRMPPRPLFRPIVSYLSKNIRRYWIKFLREEGVLPNESQSVR
ncbi:hypothetical protein SP15_040 [Bacillus phage SP-15]|uniref:Uncharacterized protein n=1 Tax=Bacillus phage SP-15 TaxID=1792032 RepID=A0A127AW04_9CAUD|nr:hypothetical protein SP15_040 [Bacillus phage SP-15]AMM44839.1 hypothetical protein SP15_040 [Bacillus phage SP-15]